MNCPKCNGRVTIKNTVETNENELYRKRVCDQCGHVFFTVEYEVEQNARFRKEWKYYVNLRARKYEEAKRKNEVIPCSSYHLRTRRTFDAYTRKTVEKEVGVCYGAKNIPECKCGGDRSKCDFYPDNRK